MRHRSSLRRTLPVVAVAAALALGGAACSEDEDQDADVVDQSPTEGDGSVDGGAETDLDEPGGDSGATPGSQGGTDAPSAGDDPGGAGTGG